MGLRELRQQRAEAKRGRDKFSEFIHMILDDDDEGWETPKLADELDELRKEFKTKELLERFSELRRENEKKIKDLDETIAKLTKLSSDNPMTASLEQMSPSFQVAASACDKDYAKQCFNTSVETVESVVDDHYILHSLLLAEKEEQSEYTGDELIKLTRTESIAMAEKLHEVSNGRLRYIAEEEEEKEEEEEGVEEEGVVQEGMQEWDWEWKNYQKPISKHPMKMARLANNVQNDDETLSEDARSSQFVMQWNAMLLNLTGVMAIAQLPTRKLNESISKADVVLSRVLQVGQHPAENLVDDFCVVIEWKCNETEGAEREGTCYALHLCKATKRRRYLVLTVSGTRVEVFGLYWINPLEPSQPGTPEREKAQLVKLDKADSLEIFLKKWLRPLVWFVRESSDDYAPAVPRFHPRATDSKRLNSDIYQISGGAGVNDLVYKVFDYVNRQYIGGKDRRRMNYDLVKKYYPQGGGIQPRKIISTDRLGIFSYAYLKGGIGEIHLPRSKEQFISVGEELKKVHEEDKYIHGDVRLANMLFPRDGRNGYIIDFDFARLEASKAKYVQGYAFKNLPRHKDARAGKAMKKIHDVFSYWVCYLLVCGENVGRRRRTLPDNVKTMEELLLYIRNDERTVAGNVGRDDIPELQVNTGTPDRTKGRAKVDAAEGSRKADSGARLSGKRKRMRK